jgi:hypothetical protein
MFLIPFLYVNVKSKVGEPINLTMLELVTRIQTPFTTRELIDVSPRCWMGPLQHVDQELIKDLM